MQIREARIEESGGIREVYRQAFSEDERKAVADLAGDLLSDESEPSTISLIVEEGGEVVGHVALSPVVEQGSGGLLGYILAPLAVLPKYQRKGMGSALVKHGLALLSGTTKGVLLVYGDPDYYGRFGFTAELAETYLPPYPLEYPFGWQGICLGEGALRKEAVTIECVPSLSQRDLW